MTVVLRALSGPEAAFGEDATYRVSRTLLLLILFLTYAVGSELITHFYTTPYVTTLAVQQAESSQFAFGPPGGGPPGGHRPANGRAAGSADPTAAAVAGAVGVVIQSLLFVLLSLATWWLLIIFVQFLGGEEEKTAEGPHRNSRYLVAYAWLPLALRRLAAGVLINLQDPRAAWNAVNLSQYRRQSAIGFSPLSLLGKLPLPDWLVFVAESLTDPFYLWLLFVIVFGGKTVFRLSLRSALLQGGFVMVLLTLYRVLFTSLGLQAGV